jgi:hypothetical protein
MSSLIPHPNQEMIPEAKAFRDSLRLEEQETFDELYLAAEPIYRAMREVGLVIPLEKVLFAMLIEQQKQIQNLQDILGRPTHND